MKPTVVIEKVHNSSESILETARNMCVFQREGGGYAELQETGNQISLL